MRRLCLLMLFAVGLLLLLPPPGLTLPGDVPRGGVTFEAAPPDEGADDEEQPRGRLLLVLDSSGSMKEPDRSGARKIDAAKRALRSVVADLPGDAEVGMRVYGATVFEKSDPGACTDSQLVVPIGPVDKPSLRREISGYQPYGETPIAYSLEQAARDLGPDGERRILLVSDGEETCDADPCAVARQLHQRGIDLKIDVVGMSVPAPARRQLQCVADAGGGTYCETGSAVEVVGCLSRAALRAVRPFSVTGTPVEGSTQPGPAPEIEPGQYVDTLGGDQEETGLRHYRITKDPGATVHAAVTARTDDPTQSDGIGLALLTDQGEECANAGRVTLADYESNPVINTAVIFAPDEDGTDDCATADALVLEVRRGNEHQDRAPDRGDLPIEILVVHEPPVDGAGSLPPEVDEGRIDQRPVRFGSARGDVVGGDSFSNAPELDDGTWTDTLQSGEMLFYRVPAEWGEAPRFALRLRADPSLDSRLDFTPVRLFAFAPDRTPISLTGVDPEASGTYQGTQDVLLGANLPEVRYRNREHYSFDTTRVGPTSLAGDYYFAVHLQEEPGNPRFQVETEIAAEVAGAPAGEPAYRTPVETEPAATPSESSSGSPAPEETPTTPPSPADEPAADEAGPLLPLPVALGAGSLILLGAGLAVWLLRRG